MLQSLWRLTGLDLQLQLLKAQVERKATDATNQVKAAIVRFALALGFAIIALIFFFMALVTGLIALYTWLDTLLGPLPALGIVAGALILVALIFVISAMAFGRSKSTGDALPEPVPVSAAVAPGLAAANGLSPETVPLAIPPTPTEPVAGNLIEPFILLIKRFITRPRTGSPLLDEIILRATPAAEGASQDIIHRAATLVRTGDRATMLSVLGASMALGWLMVKAGDLTRER